jgi:hypothetical protein
MNIKKDRGTKTETLSLRLDPKAKFILEFVSRINGQTITTIVERAIRSSADDIRLSAEEFSPGPNWEYFWDPHEGVRTLKLLAYSTYPSTFDEDDLRSFTEAHKEFFYLPDTDPAKPNRAFLQVLWPKIDEYRRVWLDNIDCDYWAGGRAMVADLTSAKIKPPTWPRTPSKPPAPKVAARGNDFDEIPF